MEIRRGGIEDLKAILAIERDAFASPWQEETFRSLMERADVDLLVAERDDDLIGYAVLWSTLDEGELANIAVAKEHRGVGVGRALMHHVVTAARNRGVRRLFLEVRESNSAAAKLYEAYEFRQIGIRRNYYKNPVEHARVLVRDLTQPGPTSEGEGSAHG